MKNLAFSIYVIIVFFSSCTKTEVIPVEYTGEPPVVVTCTVGDYEITDAAFGEYLIYLNVTGATAKAVQENGQTVTKYYIDTCEVKTRNSLEML